MRAYGPAPRRWKLASNTIRARNCKHIVQAFAIGQPFFRAFGTMPQSRLYLDHNATSPLRPEAADAVAAALRLPGNASSIHAEGRAARAVIEAARAQVAALVGARAKNVVFTSGGTEAANLALTPGFSRAGSPRPVRLLVGATEHACVLQGHRFEAAAVTRIACGPDGAIDLAALRAALAKGGPAMLALQAANNETGLLQPVAEAATLVHAVGGVVVCDAVQFCGKLPCDIGALGADALFLSAHKFGGPKGAGALVFAADSLHLAEPLLRGGGQERGLRAGTENIAAIAGFGAAAGAAAFGLAAQAAMQASLRAALEAGIRAAAPDAVFFGEEAARLPNTASFAIPGVRAETLLIALDLAGVAASSGSACSSGKVAPSHVLAAMGVAPELASGALRLSTGWSTTAAEAANFGERFAAVIQRLRQARAAA